MKQSDSLQWSASSDGFIYMGLTECTQEDKDALEAYVGEDPSIQDSSLCGRWAPEWTATENTDMGGLGSHTYEVQKVNPSNDGAVEFKPEDQAPVYHYNPDLNFVFDVIDYPNTGRAFFRSAVGSVAMPRPYSDADFILGDGYYRWDSLHKYWIVVK